MPDPTERSFVEQQYSDPGRLNARVTLHARYSTNSYGWFNWVWDRLAPGPGIRILEVGCGDGGLWRGRADAFPTGGRVILTDLSLGMLQQARQRLPAQLATCALADAQQLPLSDASLDLVIANHVLYHVPDRAQALAEIRRVLVPGGRLCATTIGQGHMGELFAWMAQAAPEAQVWSAGAPTVFTLQSGPGELAPLFEEVACDQYPDALSVTEIEPLVAYALSMDASGALAARQDALRALLQRELDDKGAVHITKESGMLMARAPRP
jgi:SAM-dependent methyltransferase